MAEIVDSVVSESRDEQSAKLVIQKEGKEASFILSGIKADSLETGPSAVKFETAEEGAPVTLQILVPGSSLLASSQETSYF